MTHDTSNRWTRRAFTRAGGLFTLGLVTAGPAGVATADDKALVGVRTEAKATPEGVTVHVFLTNLTETPLSLSSPEGAPRVALMTSSFTANGERLEPEAVPREFKPVSRVMKYSHMPLPVASAVAVESFGYTWTEACRKHAGQAVTFQAMLRVLIADRPGHRSRGKAVSLETSARVEIPG